MYQWGVARTVRGPKEKERSAVCESLSLRWWTPSHYTRTHNINSLDRPLDNNVQWHTKYSTQRHSYPTPRDDAERACPVCAKTHHWPLRKRMICASPSRSGDSDRSWSETRESVCFYKIRSPWPPSQSQWQNQPAPRLHRIRPGRQRRAGSNFPVRSAGLSIT